MTNPGSTLDLEPTLRRDLGLTWLRFALTGSAIAGTGCAVAAFFFDVEGLWALAAVSFLVQLAAVMLRVTGYATPTNLVLVSAAASAAVAPFSQAGVIAGLTTGLALGGFVAIGVFEPQRAIVPKSIALLVLLGSAIWLVESGWDAVYMSTPLAVAAVVTVSLVRQLRGHIAERGEAVVNRDRRFRDLFDRVPVGLYRTSLEGILVDANQALADLLGTRVDRIVGESVHPYLVGGGESLARLRSGIGPGSAPHVSDLQMRREDGTVIWVRDRTRAVRDQHGAIKFFEGELQDITEQVAHVEQLEALVKSKSDLIAAVSHELRTPLTAVVGFLDVLSDQFADGEDSEMLALATEQAHEVAAIVEDLLTAARLDNQELVVRADTVDIGEAVQSAIRSLGSPFVVLRLPTSLMAVGDPTRIRQILRNLLGNAQRYGRPPIAVGADVVDGRMRLTVSDKGDPIPEDVVADMFEPFYTTGGHASQPGSIGLGLAVSRLLAKRMGGDLTYQRVLDETRFTLELPSAAGEQRLTA